jgi:hypothetical protein
MMLPRPCGLFGTWKIRERATGAWLQGRCSGACPHAQDHLLARGFAVLIKAKSRHAVRCDG